MTQKRSYKQYPMEFKEEAVALVTEQGYTVLEAAEALGVATNMLYRWKENAEKQNEPPRVFRRLGCLSQATIADSSSCR